MDAEDESSLGEDEDEEEDEDENNESDAGAESMGDEDEDDDEDDVDAESPEGHTALMLAAWRGEIEVLRALLRRGADSNRATRVGGWTALMMAARNGHTSCIVALVDEGGADVNAIGGGDWSALMQAAWMDHLPACLVLIARGADLFYSCRCPREAPRGAVDVYGAYPLLGSMSPKVKATRLAALSRAARDYQALGQPRSLRLSSPACPLSGVAE